MKNNKLSHVNFILAFLLLLCLIIASKSFGQNLTQANFIGVIVPQYFSSGDGTRLPNVFRAQVTGLSPSTTYRYFCQAALTGDFGGTNPGAGNPVLINHTTSNYTYTTSPNLTSNYETFTTDASGNYTGWFCVVNTGNHRFTAGNIVYPTIVIGNTSGTVLHRRALDLGMTVLAFNTAYGANNATGIWGNTGATAKNIIALYDNVTGSGRPFSMTFVESDGTTIADVVSYYATNVNAVNGAWGTLIPNITANGVRRIDQYALSDASLVSSVTDADGVWGCLSTVTPTGGSGSPLNVSAYIITTNTTFSNPAAAYYRSKNSGEFCNVANWEASLDNTTWINASKVPDKSDNTITIRSPHTVRIASTEDTLWLDETRINTGAMLVWKNLPLRISNGSSGPDLLVEGSFKDSSSANIVFNGGATWQLAPNANFIKTGSGAAIDWRDNYEGTMATIPANSNWYVRKEGAMNPPLTSVGGTYYGNLFLENYTGAHWNMGVSSSFSGSTDFPTIKSNFDVGGAGTSTVSFSNDNTNTNPVLVMGNTIVRTGNTLNNNGTGFNLQGNLTNEGTINYGTLNSREWRFTGTANQYISGSGTLNIFRLRCNKSAGALIFNRNIQVDDAVLLDNGKVDLNQRTLTIANPSGGAVSRTNGWIESEDTDNSSKIQWNIGTTTGAHIYPFGKNSTTYIPFTLILTSGDIGNVTVSTYGTGPDNTPYPSSPVMVTNLLNGSSDNSANVVDRFWQIDRTGAMAANATLIFTYDDAEEPSDEAILNAQRYEASTNQWQPYLPGQTEDATNNTVTVPNVTTFSPWTLSKIDSPLPLRFTYFDAQNLSQQSILRWGIASNVSQLRYFSVEKSYDNINFQAIHSLPYSGSSDYQYTDLKSPGIAYYRIAVADENGMLFYSPVISVNGNDKSITMFPVPFSEKLHLIIPYDLSNNLITITGSDGKLYYSKTHNESEVEISTYHLPSGMYLLTINDGYHVYTYKVVK
ncbi:MAG: T9SS type A sorting domain-containing protein [Cytophagaceae bacterium]|nr:T9SS type A sorting domain-containing protein [Cytophagaceae bacterium]MDW8455242.1 T9SS type A sorting domain-containing protein [Cytophagaceae bacterium]